MSQYKAGLHKDVSAIFNGVSPPKSNDAQQASAAPEHQDSITQKPSVPNYVTTTEPKSQQPPLQKTDSAQQSEGNAVKKTIKKIIGQKTLEQIKSKLFTPKGGVSGKRQKATVILIPILFIVLIAMFVRAFSTPTRKASGAERFKPSKTAAATADSDDEVDWQVPEPYPETLRDPMKFGSPMSQNRAGALVVKGILYSEDNPSAIIGGQIVHEGDKVLDAVIIKINRNSVEFKADNKTWTQKVQK